MQRAATAAAVAALFASIGIAAAHMPPARAQSSGPLRRHVPPARRFQFAATQTGETAPPEAPGSVSAPANPTALLLRMIGAEKTLSYEATEATFGPGRSTEESIKHDPVRGERRESIRPPGELLVDDYHHSWLISNRNRTVTMGSSLVANRIGIAGLSRLKKGRLRAEWVGVERVAGRLADIISVSIAGGKANRGPTRRFWIDRETGLRLRSEDRDAEGRIVSGAYYTQIHFDPVFGPSDFTPPAAPTGFESLTEVKHSFKNYDQAAQAGIVIRRPDYLPAGFRLRGIAVLDTTRRRGRVRRITQRFDNGLSVLTLVQTTGIVVPKRLQRNLDPATGSGFIPLPRGERGYVWNDRGAGLTFLVIGSLPDDELKRIADSVR